MFRLPVKRGIARIHKVKTFMITYICYLLLYGYILYCGTIIVRGGLMFMNFMVFPYPHICPTKCLQGNDLSCIVLLQLVIHNITFPCKNQQNFDNPHTWAHPRIRIIPQ